MTVEILVPFIIFATIFGVLYTFLITRNKERLAMIEKGADPSIFAQRRSRIGLKIGLLSMGIAIGVLMGQMIAHLTSMQEEPATISMIFLWAGAGLVLEHFLAKKDANKNG
jgi:fucose 4-O-acetylase-like acetyltransferase